MAETKYGKYFISDPYRLQVGELAHHDKIKERNAEGLVFLNKDFLPETLYSSIVSRAYGEPDPQPFIHAHKHDVDEILIFLPLTPDGNLGADVELYMGEEGEVHTFNRPTLVYIPAGVVHCPLYYRNFQPGRQFYLVGFLLQPEYS